MKKQQKKATTKPKTKALNKALVSGSVLKEALPNYSHLDFEIFRKQFETQKKAEIKKKGSYTNNNFKYFAFVIVKKNKKYGDNLELIEFNDKNWRNRLLYKLSDRDKGDFIPIIEMKKFKRIIIDYPFSESSMLNANDDNYTFNFMPSGIIINQLEDKPRKVRARYGVYTVKKCELLIPEDYDVKSAVALKHYS